MGHVAKWSASILSMLFIISGCSQTSVPPSNTHKEAVKVTKGAPALPPRSPRTDHSHLKGDDLLVKHQHKQSKIEKKLKQSTTWANFNIPILEMHDTIAIPNDPYTMSPAQLDEELGWLKSHGFHSVTLNDIYNAIYNHYPLPSRPIALTFDDGYESNFITATPLLQKYGFIATEFMVSGFIGRHGFLTADELKQMEASHTWDIECHTVDHPNLSKLNFSDITFQVTQSKDTLQSLLGTQVDYFAYPYGYYNGRVLRALMHAGYRLAVCTRQGYANPSTDGPLLLNRIAIHQGLPLQAYAQLFAPSLVTPISSS